MLHNAYMDIGFYIMFFPIVFFYGICIGSFLNVVIYRLPRNESLVKRASHCTTCGAKIRVIDIIPIVSWVFILHGKCRNCGEKISPRYPIVEALNGIIERYNAVADDLSRYGEEADAARNEIFRLNAEITACRSEIGSMQLISDTLQRRETALQSERDAGEDTEKQAKEDLQRAQKERDELAEQAETLLREIEETAAAYEKAMEEERRLSRSADDLRLSLGRMSARLRTIEEMESNYEGYSNAVKHVMKAGMSGIHGVVAELIQVPAGYETAVETALGQSLQNIVCEDDASARRAIRSLKENKAGRMTFLPRKSIR